MHLTPGSQNRSQNEGFRLRDLADRKTPDRPRLHLLETSATSGLVCDGGVLLTPSEDSHDVLVPLTRLQLLLSQLETPEALASATSACILSRAPADLVAVAVGSHYAGGLGAAAGPRWRERQGSWTNELVNIVIEVFGERRSYNLDCDLATFVLNERRAALAVDADGRKLICAPIHARNEFFGLLHVYYDQAGENLAFQHLQFCLAAAELLGNAFRSRSAAVAKPPGMADSPLTLAAVERRHITQVLGHVCGSKQNAASILGIDRSTLHRKIKKYKIDDSELAGSRADG